MHYFLLIKLLIVMAENAWGSNNRKQPAKVNVAAAAAVAGIVAGGDPNVIGGPQKYAGS